MEFHIPYIFLLLFSICLRARVCKIKFFQGNAGFGPFSPFSYIVLSPFLRVTALCQGRVSALESTWSLALVSSGEKVMIPDQVGTP